MLRLRLRLTSIVAKSVSFILDVLWNGVTNNWENENRNWEDIG
mgnify:CR=1|jgi:hypothetical protein|tara:strand:+ start:974 stop:1102 length:129 start_codon:yes stop_codon:yes gene_type:complete